MVIVHRWLLLLDLLIWCHLLQDGFLCAGMSYLTNDHHFMVSACVRDQDQRSCVWLSISFNVFLHIWCFFLIGFCHTGPISLYVDLFMFICVYFVCFCFILHSCCIIVSAVGWTWWDWSLILRILFSFSALTLLVGSFDPYKPVPDMTYNVFGGTLNLALSIYVQLLSCLSCTQSFCSSL